MQVVDVARLAALSLRQTPGRTALTTLGVAIGVFALATIVALGTGLEVAVVAQLTDDESQTQVVVRGGFGPVPDAEAAIEGVDDPDKLDRIRKALAKRRRGGPGTARRIFLTEDALASISSRTHVAAVRPFVVDRFRVTLGEHQAEAAISYGVAPASPRWARRVLAGEPFRADARGVWLHEYLLYTWGYKSDAAQAALVGRTVVLGRSREQTGLTALLDAARSSGALDLGGVDPVAAAWMLQALARRRDRADGSDPEAVLEPPVLELPVLGVVRERIEADGFELWDDSFSMQADVFLPQDLARELFRQAPANRALGYAAAAVEVDAPEHVRAVEEGLMAEGYITASVASILERVGLALAIVTGVVSGLTAIALAVAVLGIVNTLVMSVAERTREIGILKALGATDRQVRGLFMLEGALIGLVGGAVGIGLALLVSIPGDWLHRRELVRFTQYSYEGSIFAFPPWLLGGAVLFAVALSVLAALGPATRASRVDPVEALRDE